MRNHLTLKEIADCIQVRETYAGQAFDPALEKVVRVYRRHPRALIRLIMDMADQMDAAERETTISEPELSARIQMQTGRMDRVKLHPR